MPSRNARRAVCGSIGKQPWPDASDAATTPSMEVAQAVMERAPEPVLRLSVPLKVDARAGDNWEAAH